ncbi:MAG TPA: efflux transporter outer membrane subunit [Chlamydiales bacterium]|nr:efflux transporter outer membrane subunit [Chlamydiales bacterium]
MKKIAVAFVFVVIFLGGCAVGPNYQRPETVVSDTWSADATANTEQPIDKWWEAFEDNLLTKYIDLATNQNYNVQVAESNVLRARALRRVAASTFFPQVSADVNGTKTYFSKNGPIFEIGQAQGDTTVTSSPITGLPFAVQVPQIQNLFNALLDASWELDFFGKTRRTVEAATATIESLIDYKNGVILTTQAEVSSNYIDLRGAQEKERLLKKNIQLFEQHATIIQLSLQYGYANQLDIENIEAQLASARAQLPETYAEIYRAIYAISVLTGTLPETLVDDLLPFKPLPVRPDKVAVGIRSDLLRRRPDIRSAERQLAAATAAIGVAVASFFPAVSLLANGGFQSLVLPRLFEWGSKTWAYGADVNMPIFQGGQLVGNLLLTRAEQAMQAANYQQTVLTAFRDAENSLKQYQEKVASTREYAQNVLHNKYVVAITRERYQKGLINVIDLLNNEKQLISAELTQLKSEMEGLSALIALYKSLGGNWEAPIPCQNPCSACP